MDSRKEKSLKKTYAKLLKVAFGNGSIDEVPGFVEGDVMGYGTALDEKIMSIKEFIKLLHDQRKQAAKFDDFRYVSNPVIVRISHNGNSALIVDEIELETVIKNESNILSVRMSTVLEYKDETWKIIHWHGSLAEHVSEGEDPWHVNEWKKKTERLERMVEEKTADLEEKNSELEIETALERVRTIAMGMRKPGDLLEVCKAISEQLELLQIKDIRNVQVAIINASKKHYLNYQYFTPYSEKVFEVTEYENHPASKGMVTEMKKSANSFFTGQMSGKSLEGFRDWRKRFNQFPDPLLDQSSSVYYYFYSIGEGGLGLTTYREISDSGLEIFKRFHKVFTLAFRRFQDIQKAEAQAREAQIEAALERVRSRSMGMQKSEELADLSFELVKQVEALGIDTWFCAFNIYDDDPKGSLEWGSNTQGTYEEYRTPREGIFLRYYEAGQKGESLLVNEIGEDECPAHYEYLCSLPGVGEQLLAMKDAGIPFPTSQIDHVAFFKYGYIIFITFEPVPEAHDIFKRFAKIFEQTYTRFLDLKRAEEQAREAQIEAALERVRAHAMGLRESKELRKIISIIFEELKKQGESLNECSILIRHGNTRDFTCWTTSADAELAESYYFPFFKHPILDRVIHDLDRNVEFREFTINQKELKEYSKLLFSLTDFKDAPQEYKDAIPALKELHATQAMMKHGFLEVMGTKPLPAELKEILIRFTNVIDLAYTRFLDLKRAEEQARESEIGLALERVRARTMAMRNSEEFTETTSLMAKQMKDLGEEIDQITIGIFKEEEKMIDAFGTVKGDQFQTMKVPIDEQFVMGRVHKAWKAKKRSIVIEISGEELIRYNKWRNNFLKKNIYPVDNPQGKWIVNAAIFSKGLLSFSSEKPATQESIRILERFAAVFDLTYTRFLDLQKAEAQAREAQIEAALERVRSRSIGMQSSDELVEASDVMFAEMKKLEIKSLRIGICTIDAKTGAAEIWSRSEIEGKAENRILGVVPKGTHPVFDQMVRAWKANKPYFTSERVGEEVRDYYEKLGACLSYPKLDKYNKRETVSAFFFAEGSLNVISLQPLTEEENEIMVRFARVFGQMYRRFLDLKKAEAQTREAQIELALERIRAQVTAMQASAELLDIMVMMRTEFVSLGHEAHYFWYMRYLQDHYEKAMTSGDGTRIGMVMTLPRHIHGDIKLLADWEKSDEPTVIFPMDVETAVDYVHKMITLGDFKQVDPNAPTLDDIRDIGGLTFVMARSKYGEIGFSLPGYVPDPPKEDLDTLVRFAAVFDLAYRRFEDLKSAERQNRETQIELALERVRSKTMAMQNSQEVGDTVVTLLNEVLKLGLDKSIRVGIGILKGNKRMETWSANSKTDGKIDLRMGMLDMTIHPMLVGLKKAWKSGKTSYQFDFIGEDVFRYYQALNNEPDYPFMADLEALPENEYHKSFFYSEGILFSFAPNPISDEAANVLDRFARVFGQTYRRYRDLKKAEAQAREAQIEAALEKVRSRSMGMQKSNELKEVIQVVYEQFVHLEIFIEHTGFIMDYKERDDMYIWLADKHGAPSQVTIPYFDSPHWNSFLKARKKGVDFFANNLDFEEKNKFYEELFTHIPGLTKKAKEAYLSAPGLSISTVLMDNIGLYMENFSGIPYSDEENEILKRFGKVFQQTYTRFLDLKRSEEQAREAIRQASVERVRGQISSMRTAEDLQRITPLIWKELEILEVPFIRCGVFIVDEKKKQVNVFLTTPEGKPLGVLHLPPDANALTKHTVAHWKKRKVYHEHWDRQAFIDWMQSMVKLGQVKAEEYQGGEKPPESLDLYFVPFDQGMLYVGNTEPLKEEKIKLVKALADAFALAYARYEDFKYLEEAKEQVEKTLNDLKSAQSQLIHAEKMASLGELTAGIAHEIQNPLNFVNNFSEVSTDLIEEMYEELKEGDPEEAKAIANDLLQNLEKIHHHGQRASSIVKGMLEHSRSGSGDKTPTDINSLADEYLRLAYHGLRAKNKSFQADFNLEADPALPMIKVIGQDIGRVLLNLINNAFYACTERSLSAVSDKSKKQQNGYKPTVIVSTKLVKDWVEIRVKDNGNGIPKKVQEKIFQPFFTTKPTGEGTGLGLSLSYDIITKGHSGELTVETKEGEGTEFIINLPTT